MEDCKLGKFQRIKMSLWVVVNTIVYIMHVCLYFINILYLWIINVKLILDLIKINNNKSSKMTTHLVGKGND